MFLQFSSDVIKDFSRKRPWCYSMLAKSVFLISTFIQGLDFVPSRL